MIYRPRLLEESSQSLTGRSRGASTRSVLQTIKPSANHEPLAANHLKGLVDVRQVLLNMTSPDEMGYNKTEVLFVEKGVCFP